MMSKRKLTKIKFDKEQLITKFAFLDHNNHEIINERIIFNANSLADEVEAFLRGIVERHYPVTADAELLVNTISIDYDFGEAFKLAFSLKFSGDECGEMSFSFPSLPRQIVARNSDLIEGLSDLALEYWDDFQDSLPKQGDLFAMPDLESLADKFRSDLESVEQIEQRVNRNLGVA